METKQLFLNAREAFIKKYAQTPEDAGFSIMNSWHDQVMLSVDQKTFTAFSKQQQLIKKTIREFCFALAFLGIGTWLAMVFYLTTAPNKFFAWLMIALCGLTVLCFISVKRKLQCNRYDAVIFKEKSHLFFDGKSFYQLKPETVNPHTAFF